MNQLGVFIRLQLHLIKESMNHEDGGRKEGRRHKNEFTVNSGLKIFFSLHFSKELLFLFTCSFRIHVFRFLIATLGFF